MAEQEESVTYSLRKRATTILNKYVSGIARCLNDETIIKNGRWRVWDHTEGVFKIDPESKEFLRFKKGDHDVEGYQVEHVFERQFLAILFVKCASDFANLYYPDSTFCLFPPSALIFLGKLANNDANLVWVDTEFHKTKTRFFGGYGEMDTDIRKYLMAVSYDFRRWFDAEAMGIFDDLDMSTEERVWTKIFMDGYLKHTPWYNDGLNFHWSRIGNKEKWGQK